MATEFYSRILLKHDTEANWKKATNFTPKEGEIIIYDMDDYPRIKIGNNSDNVNDLPFITDNYLTLTDGVKLAAGDDLNSCTTPGNYIAGNSAIASGVANAPITSAGFKCTTFGGYIANRLTQIATTNTANIYFRQYNGTSWSDWAHLYDMDGLSETVTALNNNYTDHIHPVNEFTPAGTIAKATVTQTGSVSSTFTGSSATTAASTSKVLVTKGDHVHAYTPAGTVSQPTFTGTQKSTGAPSATTKAYSITGVGSAASLSAAITNKKMTLSWTANTVPTRAEVTLPSSEHTHTYTPEGTVSKPTFTGIAGSVDATATTSKVDVNSADHTHTVTAKGSVSSTFSGDAIEHTHTFTGTKITGLKTGKKG